LGHRAGDQVPIVTQRDWRDALKLKIYDILTRGIEPVSILLALTSSILKIGFHDSLLTSFSDVTSDGRAAKEEVFTKPETITIASNGPTTIIMKQHRFIPFHPII
jgi:hypothetical protein